MQTPHSLPSPLAVLLHPDTIGRPCLADGHTPDSHRARTCHRSMPPPTSHESTIGAIFALPCRIIHTIWRPPASGLWYVHKCPGSTYKETEFWFFYHYGHRNTAACQFPNLLCFLILHILSRVSSDPKRVYDISLSPPLPPQPGGHVWW